MLQRLQLVFEFGHSDEAIENTDGTCNLQNTNIHISNY